MRLFYGLVTSLVIVLSKTADALATTSDRADDEFNILTESPRVEMNSSIAPSLLESSDSAVDRINLDRQDEEERGLTYEQFLPKVIVALRTAKGEAVAHIHQAKFGEEFNLQAVQEKQAIVAEIVTWFDRVWALDDKVHRHRFKEVVTYLMRDVGHEKRLVSFLLLLKKELGMEHRAHHLIKALMETQSDAVDLMFKELIKAEIPPDTVYSLLPIAAEEPLTYGDDHEARLRNVCDKIVQWLLYVREFNEPEKLYTAEQIFSLLVEKRGVEEMMLILHWLGKGASEWVDLLYELTSLMVLVYPETVRSMFGSWLKSHNTPFDIYGQLVVGVEIKMSDVVDDAVKSSFLLRKNIQWIAFADLYASKFGTGKYPISDMVHNMVYARPSEMRLAGLEFRPYQEMHKLVTTIRSLRFVHGMKDLADSLLVELAVEHPETQKMVLKVWQDSSVHPEEVYRLISEGPMIERTVGTREEQETLKNRPAADAFREYAEAFYTKRRFDGNNAEANQPVENKKRKAVPFLNQIRRTRLKKVRRKQ